MGSTSGNSSYYQPKKPKLPMPVIFIIITLSVLATILTIMFIKNTRELSDTREEVQYVEEQKKSLETELNGLIIGYDSLKTENDSINQELEVQQNKIRRLLGINASNTTKIRLYEKELKTLREVMRSYIIQIDSLNTKNRELTEENVAVRTKLRKVQSDYQDLSDTKDELSSKVALAQKLTAKNIISVGLNSRSKEKDKTDKIEKLRVCFTIRENHVADPGKKMIYLRIIRPDEIVLSSPEAGMFDFNGEQLVYSAKRELEYDNQDIDMCIFWDKGEELVEGTYNFILYCEGYEIGSATLYLK